MDEVANETDQAQALWDSAWENGVTTGRSEPLAVAFGADALAPRAAGSVVRGLLHAGAITLFYGPPKSGKSFLLTDLALSIAAHEADWCGHEIRKPGAVLYVACEGHAGFWKRLSAATIRRGWTDNDFPADFILASGHPALIRSLDGSGVFTPDPASVLEALETARVAGRHVVAVMIDTIFRSIGAGDINRSTDTNAYVAALDAISAHGVAVAAVHHEIKAGGTPAGSVTLIGSADNVVRVWRREADRLWQVELAKDDAETAPRRFRLEVVEIGHDPEGFPATSCVVVDEGADGGTEAPKRPGKPRPMSVRYLGAMHDAMGTSPQAPPGTVGREAWQAELTRLGLLTSPDGDKATERRRQNAFNANTTRMIAEGLVATADAGRTFMALSRGSAR